MRCLLIVVAASTAMMAPGLFGLITLLALLTRTARG